MKKYFKIFRLIVVVVGALAQALILAPVEAEDAWDAPELYFKSVNPGYTVDGENNVGEMFEIVRGGDSDELISLAGVTVRYTNTSGKETVLVELPESSFLAGESFLLRLASSPGSELANMTYKKTLAMNAKLELVRGDEVIDVVCWTGKDGCVAAFDNKSPTTIVRNLKTGEFEHLTEYNPVYNEENFVVKNLNPDLNEDKNGDDGKGEAGGQCKNLQFSEILSYYAETQAEQFVEFYNAGAEQVLLDGCSLRYKNKLYGLRGIIKPDEYFVRAADDFKLTKNPTNVGVIEIIDVDGAVVDRLEYPNGQKKGVSYAMIGYNEKGEEIWRTTYKVTPGEPNIYQEFKTCEEGKVINEETGNCVKVTEVVEKVCAEGQYLNPLTGRCKKIEVEEEKVCAEGYYFYEPTGRCRKIVANDGADYSMQKEDGKYKEETSFVAVYAVLAVVVAGVVYIIYEYRREIRKFMRRFLKRK